MEVLNIQPTPNPNAFKFVVDQTLQAEGSRYYNTSAEAGNDPLATALFAIHGVETVYFAQDFATVTSSETVSRETVHTQVQEVLKTHEGGGGTATATATTSVDRVVTDDAELIQQIDALLDDRVRPALAGDGGGLQVVALESKVLTIRYEGACGSCPSSIAGTLMAIQNLLQMEVDEEITVVSG
jgi:NFU1 iron-sulfur cluster scaffold homolog, mitochondrial